MIRLIEIAALTLALAATGGCKSKSNTVEQNQQDDG